MTDTPTGPSGLDVLDAAGPAGPPPGEPGASEERGRPDGTGSATASGAGGATASGPGGATASGPGGAAGSGAGGGGGAPVVPGPGSVHPRLWQRRVAVLRDQGRRRLRWIVAAVVVLIGVCVAVVVLHTPLVAVRSTTVLGAPISEQEAVLSASGLADAPPLIDVDPRTTAARVEALPWVAHAVVVRHWPDAVTVTVTPRTPLGAVPRPGGGAAVVDASGHVISWEASLPAGLLVSGPVPPGRPGTVLGAADHPALKTAAALPAAVAGRVRQVSVNGSGVVAMNLGGGVSAVLGTTAELPQKLAALVTVIDRTRPTGPAVIDLTIPSQPAIGLPPGTR
ncbi:MAG TPA: FtsQ-type POTRA domain-containing protein [Acidimicrobiales bacterium]|nr:FtsQ-type POTRA domain-containing protein [Acidimicrobiales bacterium]